ncbi:carbohydrate kinase [Bacillus sp. MRMR6]|uniref:carbohydrate kinase family protein n=1 Tax=Bacillus sp. MRMR6 TaxID=1928617 RepID=UPI000B018BF8|nr:carbohydrate kinase [Bacillus sp. MRMR6]
MKKQGVISLGEAFVDLISVDSTNTKYQQMLGGATVNVAAGVKRQGIPSYYLCKFGTNQLSEFVESELSKERINTNFCVRTSVKDICVVYVHLDEKGERYFHQYINNTPDVVLTENELDEKVFNKVRIFYFGSGTLFHETAKRTTMKALKFAREANTLIAFDANLRLKRWESASQCRRTVCSQLEHVDIVKLTEEELFFLTETDLIEDALKIVSVYNIPYLFITLGSKGAIAVMKGRKVNVPSIEVDAIDTTGAGDAFMAALLYQFHEKGLPTNLFQLEEYTAYANRVAAMTTTQIGSLTAMKPDNSL